MSSTKVFWCICEVTLLLSVCLFVVFACYVRLKQKDLLEIPLLHRNNCRKVYDMRTWIENVNLCIRRVLFQSYSRVIFIYYLSRSFLSHSLNYQWSWYDQLVQDPVFFNEVNPLSANPTKWSNTLKQFIGNLPKICLSMFDYFVILALKGLRFCLFSNYKETVTGTIQNKEFVKIESWLPRIIVCLG